MSKKVLYIDSDAPVGHLNFNRIWLKALCKENIELTLCLPRLLHDKLGVSKTKNIAIIPDFLYTKKKKIIWHIYSFIRYIWLLFQVRFRQYDVVIFSSFNTVPFCIASFFLRKKCYLVCHNNIQIATQKKIVKFAFRFIGRRHTFIVFEEYIKAFLENAWSCPHVVMIHHGFVEPQQTAVGAIGLPDSVQRFSQGKTILFMPSLSSTSQLFLRALVNHSGFARFLQEHNCVVIHKGCQVVSSGLFFSLSQRLSDDDYNALLMGSDIVLLPYDPAFNYRVSAVLFECIINHKKCIVSNIDAFVYYKRQFPNLMTFTTIDSLIDSILYYLHQKEFHYAVPNNFNNPDFKSLFNAASGSA